MKKTLLTAAFAALALGAQAVTVGWTSYPGSPAQQQISSLTGGVSVSLGSLTSFAGDIENETTAPFQVTAGKTYSVINLAFGIWSERNWGTDDSKQIGAVVVKDNAIVGTSTATLTQFGGNGDDANHAYPGANDDKGFIAFDFEGFDATTADTFTVYFVNTTNPSTITSVDDIAANRYDVSGVGLIQNAYRAEVLPEPTALALLALGVAGVALRRRA